MNSNLDLPMSKLTRRNFIKLLGRGGIVAAVASVFGLPEVKEAETEEWKIVVPNKEPRISYFPMGTPMEKYPDEVDYDWVGVVDCGGYVVPDVIAEKLREAAKDKAYIVGEPKKVNFNIELNDVITSRGFVVVEEHYEIEGGEQIRVIDKMVPA